MTNEIQTIDFHGDGLACVLKDGTPHVSVRHVCEALGVDITGQLQKLKTAPWATIEIISTVAGDGKARDLAMIPVKSLSMWMATINPRKVAAEVRAKLERYQLEAADVLDRYFRQGERFEQPEPEVGPDASLSLQQIALMAKQGTAILQLAVQAERQAAQIAEARKLADSAISRISVMEDAAASAVAHMASLPAPSVSPPPISDIDRTEQLVRWWAKSHGGVFRDAWNRLYDEIRRRLHFDARARRKNPGDSILDVCRREHPDGMTQSDFEKSIYAIAHELFPPTLEVI